MLEDQGEQVLPLGLLVEGEPVVGVVEEDNGGWEVSEGGRGGGVTIPAHFVHTRLWDIMIIKARCCGDYKTWMLEVEMPLRFILSMMLSIFFSP